MNKILEQLLDPVFWFAVVVVGVLVNIGSHYVRIAVESRYSRYSEKLRAKREQVTQERNKRIERLAVDQFYLIAFQHRELKQALYAFFYIITCVSAFATATYSLTTWTDVTMAFVSVIGFVFGINQSYRAFVMSQEINVAMEIREDQLKAQALPKSM
jgi:hypothetical protein